MDHTVSVLKDIGRNYLRKTLICLVFEIVFFLSGGRMRLIVARIDGASVGSAIVAKVCSACEVAVVHSDGENKEGLALGKKCLPKSCFSARYSYVTGAVKGAPSTICKTV